MEFEKGLALVQKPRAEAIEDCVERQTKMEPDLPPEYCRYQDEGCEMAISCLKCPFQQCVYEPGDRQHWFKRLRDREVIKLYSKEGKSVKELAVIFGLSQRTIQRALKSSLPKPKVKESPRHE